VRHVGGPFASARAAPGQAWTRNGERLEEAEQRSEARTKTTADAAAVHAVGNDRLTPGGAGWLQEQGLGPGADISRRPASVSLRPPASACSPSLASQ